MRVLNLLTELNPDKYPRSYIFEGVEVIVIQKESGSVEGTFKDSKGDTNFKFVVEEEEVRYKFDESIEYTPEDAIMHQVLDYVLMEYDFKTK